MFVYASSASDVLELIYSVDNGTPGVLDASDTHFNFTGNVFQNELAGHTGADNNCLLWPANLSMQWDSYITFDDTTSCSVHNPFFEAMLIPDAATVIDAFEEPTNGDNFDGGDFWMDDGTGNIYDPELLCSGEYDCAMIDDLNCVYEEIIVIESESLVEATINPENATCYGFCDGFICVSSVTTLSGQYEITCTGGFPGACDGIDGFIGLCACEYMVTVADPIDGCSVEFGPYIIMEPAPMDVIATTTNVTCFGEADGTVLIDCLGGELPIFIDPIGQECPVIITDLEPGPYSYLATDGNGCTVDLIAEIGSPEPIVFENLVVHNSPCGNECTGWIDFILTGGDENYSITLNDEPVTEIPPNLCPDTFTLCATDGLGCSTCEVLEVQGPPSLAINVQTNKSTCEGMSNGSVQILVLGGMGEYDISFSDEELDPNALLSGTYEIFVVDENECSATQEVTIENEFDKFLIDIVTTPETCWNTKDGLASAHVFGGSEPYLYSWDDPMFQSSPIAIGLEAYRDYNVEVVDGNGCEQSETITFDASEGCFFVATGITPNGDGSNDEWLIGGLDQFPQATVQVFYAGDSSFMNQEAITILGMAPSICERHQPRTTTTSLHTRMTWTL